MRYIYVHAVLPRTCGPFLSFHISRSFPRRAERAALRALLGIPGDSVCDFDADMTWVLRGRRLDTATLRTGFGVLLARRFGGVDGSPA